MLSPSSKSEEIKHLPAQYNRDWLGKARVVNNGFLPSRILQTGFDNIPEVLSDTAGLISRLK